MTPLTYRKYLPSYLDGENIRKHATNIEEQDNKEDNKINLYNYWNILDRPILIKKEQDTPGIADITVYINLINDTIKTLKINNTTIKFSQEEAVTQFTYHYDTNTDTIAVNPNVTVTLETYTDYEYIKCYPENDTLQESYYDHDYFLDMIGSLLGIPRRQYTQFKEEDIARTTPPFFGKELVDGYYMPTTEDDYYYYQRLTQFIEEYNYRTAPTIIPSILYGIDITQVNMDDQLCKMDISNMNNYYMTTKKDYNSSSYRFKIQDNTPINIDIPETETIRQLIASNMPVTKNPICYYMQHANISLNFKSKTYKKAKALIKITSQSNKPITNEPIQITIDDNTTIKTKLDKNGEYLLDLSTDQYMLEAGEHTITINFPETEQYYTANLTENFTISYDKLNINYTIDKTSIWYPVLELTVQDNDGEPIPNKTINITTQNYDEEITTDENGYATTKIREHENGEITIKSTKTPLYPETIIAEPYTPPSHQLNFDIYITGGDGRVNLFFLNHTDKGEPIWDDYVGYYNWDEPAIFKNTTTNQEISPPTDKNYTIAYQKKTHITLKYTTGSISYTYELQNGGTETITLDITGQNMSNYQLVFNPRTTMYIYNLTMDNRENLDLLDPEYWHTDSTCTVTSTLTSICRMDKDQFNLKNMATETESQITLKANRLHDKVDLYPLKALKNIKT